LPQNSIKHIESAGYFEEDPCSNSSSEIPMIELISRRGILRATAAGLAAAWLGNTTRAEELLPSRLVPAVAGQSTLTFKELRHGCDPQVAVAEGYDAQVLLRWGDPLFSDGQSFDPLTQDAGKQSRQFGYNCDFIAFLPLPDGAGGTRRGLLCVNHEYTDTNLMFPGIVDHQSLESLSKEYVDIELAAHGHTVCEIQQVQGRWVAAEQSPLNRRITALDTIMSVSGPASGHARLSTSDDASGQRVIGTLNNCAGGVTPWGTMLICEENFNNYFSGDATKTPEMRNHKRYAVHGPSRFNPAWAKHYLRYDIEREPNEPNRFGWVVEFDPYDPASVPVKRTALGRMKHEGAGIVVNHDGRVVIYCGDDERFEYVYKFVTNRPYDARDRKANHDLLDDGTLYVAKFSDDGTLRWLPLVHGTGPLTAANEFHSQADVVIEARRAADLLGATPMDRPEDVEPSPTTGHIFVILSNNNKRTPDQLDAANPRPANEHGHIIELVPPRRDGVIDHAADTFHWEVFLRAGDPSDPAAGASYHAGVSENGWFSCPDNGTFDNQGRLWLTTDSDHKLTGFGDGVYACDTAGAGRALPKLFFRGPNGSEVSGVCLTPDNETLFVSVQHPGEEDGSDFQKPSTRWPDFQSGMPPRPAVVAITRRGGGRIGG
jgi:secreted PhoX family phosphatase